MVFNDKILKENSSLLTNNIMYIGSGKLNT